MRIETPTMGCVLTAAKIENLGDVYETNRGRLPAGAIRPIQVEDALVDTGATLISMPTRLIQELGLRRTAIRRVRSSLGVGEAGM